MISMITMTSTISIKPPIPTTRPIISESSGAVVVIVGVGLLVVGLLVTTVVTTGIVGTGTICGIEDEDAVALDAVDVSFVDVDSAAKSFEIIHTHTHIHTDINGKLHCESKNMPL